VLVQSTVIVQFGVKNRIFQGFWQTNIDGLYVNGKQVAGTTAAVIDSGTTMMIGDDETVQALYEQIPGSFLIGSGYYSST